MLYLDYTKEYWALDIEGDGLPSNRVWCVVLINAVTQETIRMRNYDDIRSWFNGPSSANRRFIGHNIIGYDAPTLNRIAGTKLSISQLIDTFILSCLYNPSLDGGHSLEAWGKRLRFPKTEWNDWSKWSQEMEDYCENDTQLCLRVYKTLAMRMKDLKFSDYGIELEHRSWFLIEKQKKNGFAFKIKEAHELYSFLRKKENEIKEQAYEYWPPRLECVGTYKRPYVKSGAKSANFQRHEEQYEKVVVHPSTNSYDVYDYVYFDLGSPTQRVDKLLELGWKPREYTKTGNPQPTYKGRLNPSLEEFVQGSGNEQVRLIVKWIEINARANNLNTWIEAYNDTTGCIHGSLWLANTLRYKHSAPNTANIPAVRLIKDTEGNEHPALGDEGAYTYEARDLWTTRDPETRILVGVDAKGIQLRVLAHYLNNPKFMEAVLDGDPHSYNQEIGGFATRSIAKTFIYSFLLGAGDAKVGQIIGGTQSDGKEVKSRFISNFPGLSNLLDDLERQIARTGRIILCDGTPLIVTAPHTRLGYLLQGDENRIMKQAAIYADASIRKRGLDILKVGDIHDEWQNDALRKHAEEFAFDVCPDAFARSGQRFNYRLPIDCDAKLGLTWAETH